MTTSQLGLILSVLFGAATLAVICSNKVARFVTIAAIGAPVPHDFAPPPPVQHNHPTRPMGFATEKRTTETPPLDE